MRKSVSVAVGFVTSRWQDTFNGLWFVPGVIAVLALGLAACLVRIDHGVGHVHASFLFGGSPSAARSILSTIAGSLITVAGLVFSLTITTLQLAANQFTPRALRGFLSDRLTQIVAGSFVGIFAYCLLVLTTVRSKNESGTSFVPSLSITVAIVLSFVGLALLLLFIHHTAQSIQVSTIAARIAHETGQAVGRLYPATAGAPRDEEAVGLLRSWRAGEPPRPIYPARPGYVQAIALDDLARAIARPRLRVHVTVCPGDFVVPQQAIAEVWPPAVVDETVAGVIRGHIAIRAQRDIHQDVAFGVRQLADIALKALSPGINDPTTAVTAIGYLQAILARLAAQELPSAVRYMGEGAEDAGAVTIVARQRTFADFVELVVEIGRAAADNARVADTLLEALGAIAAVAAERHDARRMAVVSEVADTVAGPALAAAQTDHDRRLVTTRRAQVARLTAVDGAADAADERPT